MCLPPPLKIPLKANLPLKAIVPLKAILPLKTMLSLKDVLCLRFVVPPKGFPPTPTSPLQDVPHHSLGEDSQIGWRQ